MLDSQLSLLPGDAFCAPGGAPAGGGLALQVGPVRPAGAWRGVAGGVRPRELALLAALTGDCAAHRRGGQVPAVEAHLGPNSSQTIVV